MDWTGRKGQRLTYRGNQAGPGVGRVLGGSIKVADVKEI